MSEYLSDFDKIFEIVGSNKLAKALLNSGLSVEEVREIYRGK